MARFLKLFSNLGRIDEVFRCVKECPGWSRIVPGYLGLGASRFPCGFETRSGERLTLATFEDLVTCWMVFIRHDYAVETNCQTIVDAGANIGAFTLFAARSAPQARIIALEPFPSTFERLRSHVEQSPYRDRITCRDWALCGSDGVRRMDDSPMASQFRGLLIGDARRPGVAVEAVSLASLLERERLDRVDLLKLDVEGSEYEIMELAPPAILQRVGSIALEYHPDGSKPSLFQKLGDAGFELVLDEPSPTAGYGLARLRGRPDRHGDLAQLQL
jgi:FkbM family methyltransferase